MKPNIDTTTPAPVAVAPATTGKITAARITNLPQMFGPLPAVIVTIDGAEVRLFDYYSDELSFSSDEFVGLTVEEGRALKSQKDTAYLQA